MIKIVRLFPCFVDPAKPDETALRVTGSEISTLGPEVGGCAPTLGTACRELR